MPRPQASIRSAAGIEGGEDFELLVTFAGGVAFPHLAGRFRARFGRELLRVGIATGEPGLRRADGTPVTSTGWDHLRPGP